MLGEGANGGGPWCRTLPNVVHLPRRYMDSIPEILGKLYHSLGFEIPQKLASVLPTDFFSDDSVTQESTSPLPSVPLTAGACRPASGGADSDQLEELRTRSAKKRR